MSYSEAFEVATAGEVRAAFGLNIPKQRHLVATPVDLHAPRHEFNENARPSNRMVFTCPMQSGVKAEDVMVEIGRWLKEAEVFDQRMQFDRNWQDYRVSLYVLPRSDAKEPELLEDFHLTRYLFADRKSQPIPDYDYLMRTIDRDALANAMFATLTDRDMGAGLSSKRRDPDAPPPWQDDFRTCCHPAHVDSIHRSSNPIPAYTH